MSVTLRFLRKPGYNKHLFTRQEECPYITRFKPLSPLEVSGSAIRAAVGMNSCWADTMASGILLAIEFG